MPDQSKWTPVCGLTPYRVFCRDCGLQHLSQGEYLRMVLLSDRPDSVWACPRCGDYARWDDNWFEGYVEREADLVTDLDSLDQESGDAGSGTTLWDLLDEQAP